MKRHQGGNRGKGGKHRYSGGSGGRDFSHAIQKNQELTGMLITCAGTNEKAAVQDIYKILNRFTEELVPGFEEINENSLGKRQPDVSRNDDHHVFRLKDDSREGETKVKENGEDKVISEKEGETDVVKAEMGYGNGEQSKKEREAQRDKRQKPFQQMRMKAKGMIFIIMNKSINEKLSPFELSKSILDSIDKEKVLLTRYCSRIYPIQYAVDASLSTFESLMEKMVKEKLPEHTEIQKKTWCLRFKCRSNSKFKRDDFFSVLLRLVPPCYHFIQYKGDTEIFIDITHHTMCLSILTPYSDHKYYSFQKCIEQPSPKQKPTHDTEDEKQEEEEDEELEEEASEKSDIDIF